MNNVVFLGLYELLFFVLLRPNFAPENVLPAPNTRSRRCAATESAAWRGSWLTWRERRRPSTRSTRWQGPSFPW